MLSLSSVFLPNTETCIGNWFVCLLGKARLYDQLSALTSKAWLINIYIGDLN